MNFEFIDFLSTLIAIIIFVGWFTCWTAGLLGAMGDPFSMPERFTIGYYDYEEETVAVPKVKKSKSKKSKSRPKTKKKSAPKPKAQPKPVVNHQFQNDCIGALVGLGVKRAEARRLTATYILANPDCSNVGSFIAETFRK